MNLAELIQPERVRCGIETSSKKRALERLSELLASIAPDITAEEIFESLIGRERLGSTGLGHGVAIPHGRLENLRQPAAAFITLKRGVDFDAPDNQPVDLLFALLVPAESTQDHLDLLAQLAQMFSDAQFRQQLRECSNNEDLQQRLAHWRPHRASA
ncbi:PTS IIA-like nitrogen regulatory protein PtsN [Thiohalobacter sp. IOR34]|uniref:PTS IIA-like nitrogen regulatory protein PtsN n=1 Tax=Thiohalobacter sp. IOR34 TaxID=3057176 RepID=UPI0025B08D07|nr:PTS IIA-like nitrogen regulatory protein PtsN [Thiohalobacter sp. IOR34]WJW74861.1 PTS IIA-like nitrogen regulatory protein PtsN [Thiohalobacter sp. IOR34]